MVCLEDSAHPTNCWAKIPGVPGRGEAESKFDPGVTVTFRTRVSNSNPGFVTSPHVAVTVGMEVP